MRAYFIFNGSRLVSSRYNGGFIRRLINPLEYRRFRRYAVSIIENVDTTNEIHRYNTVNRFGLTTLVVRHYNSTMVFMTNKPHKYSYRALVRDFLASN